MMWNAEEAMRENALLVFNQQYVTNTGVSISVQGKPLKSSHALSGTVEDVVADAFKGDEIILSHADGLKTIYRSVTGILLKKVMKWTKAKHSALLQKTNGISKPASILHFEVQKDGVAVNPRSYLAF